MSGLCGGSAQLRGTRPIVYPADAQSAGSWPDSNMCRNIVEYCKKRRATA